MSTLTWKSIPGWFDFGNLYDAAIGRASNGAKFVECGSYMGRSAVYMGTQIAASGKTIAFDAVDNFSWDPDRGGATPDQTQFCIDNSPAAGFVNLVNAEQVARAATYADASLDFVFIDSDHTYEGTKAAILAYLPKMKSGGVLAGHDCEVVHATFPGVLQAVQECLPGYVINGRSFVYNVP